jgi:NAD(P)-dependent dehydrogenase (short-subunit alcohol dehydrogenase family)
VTADDLLRFDGRVAVITGAGRGMGRAHARLLASRGASVVVNDLAAPDDPATRVAEEIVSDGGHAVASTEDIATEAGGRALIDTALDAFGRIDIVVNNAGIMKLSRFEDLAPDAFDRTMKVNTYGPYYVTRAAWPHFLEQRYGRAVMISSSAALFGLPDRADYGASKAALAGLARSLASEADGCGIGVNVVFPTAITQMSTPPVRERVAGRLGMSAADEDLPALTERSTGLVAPVVAWLAHETCTANGEIFEAGSGHVGRIFIAATKGYDNVDMTIEDVGAHLEELLATDGFDLRRSYSTRASGVTASAPAARP